VDYGEGWEKMLMSMLAWIWDRIKEGKEAYIDLKRRPCWRLWRKYSLSTARESQIVDKETGGTGYTS